MNGLTIITQTLIFYLHFWNTSSELPVTTCQASHPFRMSDATCASFNDICIVKGDEDCDLLQKSCTQCPPSNFTVILLNQILNTLKNYESSMKNNAVKTDDLRNELKNEMRNECSKTGLIIISVVIIALSLVQLSILIPFYYYSRKNNKNIKKSNSNSKVPLIAVPDAPPIEMDSGNPLPVSSYHSYYTAFEILQNGKLTNSYTNITRNKSQSDDEIPRDRVDSKEITSSRGYDQTSNPGLSGTNTIINISQPDNLIDDHKSEGRSNDFDTNSETLNGSSSSGYCL